MSVDENVEKLKPSYVALDVKWGAVVENSIAVLKVKSSIWLSNPLQET